MSAEPAISPEFRLPIEPTPEDIDAQGHVSNLVYLRYVIDAATAHSESVGWDHAAYVRLGSVFVVRRHELDYLAPSYAADRLVAITWIATFTAATSERRTRIVRLSDDREVARAVTLWAMVSTDTGRPRRIPPEVRSAFALSLPSRS